MIDEVSLNKPYLAKTHNLHNMYYQTLDYEKYT